GLTGDLVIENWSNLERLDCYNNQLKSLTLINCPKLTRIECSDNIITNLIINNCSEVGVLNVSDNLLNNLGFLDSLNPEKLAVLYLTNNNFSPQNISLFSKFANLKNLYLTNNRFYGSLQSLNNCKKLEKLSISGTEIIEGLEYLPDDLNEIDSVNAQELGESSKAQPYFQELKSSFQGLVLNLQKDQIISEREKKIVELFKENQRLTNLIKEQKEIINDYLRFFPEKEILQKLIQAHLEFTEAKKQNQPFIKLRKQKEAIYNELTEKVGEEVMEEVENVLDKYEKLKSLESELEKTEADLELTENLQKNQIQPFRRKRSQSLLIVEAEYKGKLEAKDQEVVRIHQLLNQVMLISRSQQIINISDVSQSGINIAGDNSYLSNKSTTNYRTNYQQLAAETENQIIAFLSNKEIIPQEQKVINKTILFLGTKELFVNYRQTTINNLIDCYNKLEKRLGSKLHKFTTAVSMTNIAGKLASIIPGGGVAEAPLGILGDTINLTGTIIQGKLLDKFTKQFQEILAKDKKNLSLFDGNYLELRNIIWGDEKTSRGEIVADIIKTLKLERTKISPFSDDYNAFSQSVSGIWQSRSSIDLGEMKSSIEAVINDFAKLKQKLQEEKEQLSRQT
ncbi:324_t:CDS:2, partial [Racocetra persica]